MGQFLESGRKRPREGRTRNQGRLRSKVQVPSAADADAIEAAAREDERVAELLAEQEVVKVVVPGRLINFVTR